MAPSKRPIYSRGPDGLHAGTLVCQDCGRTSISVISSPSSCAHCGWRNPNAELREKKHIAQRKKLRRRE